MGARVTARRVVLPTIVVIAIASLGLVGVQLYSAHVATVTDTTLRLGTPSAVTVSDHSFPGTSAIRSTTVSVPDPRISRILDDLSRLPYLGDNVVSSCPNDDESYYELRFSYSQGKTRIVEVRKTGCRDVFVDGRWSRRAPEDWSPLLADLDEALRK